ncbi:hypothetical protein SAMN05443999_1192 [Roseovarius azorensis]|uniref:HutD protein n=1 Tax=Roseovarius azorensis TaxID=1287727 RepID=A0A1H7X6Y6_9RHOB|nr:HutD family protein [Roseovarius azorensis]SEM29441.1 hypothetical protein SAMN05443999_1192 [Roseovarius azorensis]
MRLIPYSRLVAAPWKNGGGETREIAVSPSGAGYDDFDWRLSIATIAEDGAFSAFPGIDRTLILLAGKGVAMRLGDQGEHVLQSGQRLQFAGEQIVQSRLLDGTVQDLNVMLRRDRMTAHIDTEPLQRRTVLDLGIGGGAIFVCEGQAVLSDGTVLGRWDTILSEADDMEQITLTGKAGLILIRFHPVPCA